MTGGFPYPQTALQNVSNYTPSNLSKWRKGVAGVKAGTANSRVLVIGDSTTIGIAASGAWTTPNCLDQIVTGLNAAGVAATGDCHVGFSVAGATTGSRLGTDTRWSAGNWSSGNTTLGGAILLATGAGTNAVFTPSKNTDTANVFYSKYTTAAIATAQLGAGSTVNLDYSLTTAMATATATTTLGANTLKFNWVSGGTTYVEGIECYNSAVKSVNVFNCGWWGAQTSNFTGSANSFSPLNMITYLAPSLTIINLGINDWRNSVSVATYTANIQSIITAAKTSGDVILVTPTPDSTFTSSQAGFVNALYSLAANNGCVLVDNYARWVSYAVSNPLGYYADSVHPTALGYADQAQTIKNVLLSV